MVVRIFRLLTFSTFCVLVHTKSEYITLNIGTVGHLVLFLILSIITHIECFMPTVVSQMSAVCFFCFMLMYTICYCACWTVSFEEYQGKPAPVVKSLWILLHIKMMEEAVATTVYNTYANYLHRDPVKLPPPAYQHSVFHRLDALPVA